MRKTQALAGKNTAKRKIQIREYIEERSKAMRSHSDPFVCDENAGSHVMNLGPMKFSFRTDYIPDNSSDEDEGDTDGILTRRMNLDEADRFLAALRMPKLSKAKNKPQTTKPLIIPVDLKALKEQSDKLEKLRMAEATGEEEEESDC